MAASLQSEDLHGIPMDEESFERLEVLSPSTERYDYGEKLARYQRCS